MKTNHVSKFTIESKDRMGDFMILSRSNKFDFCDAPIKKYEILRNKVIDLESNITFV